MATSSTGRSYFITLPTPRLLIGYVQRKLKTSLTANARAHPVTLPDIGCVILTGLLVFSAPNVAALASEADVTSAISGLNKCKKKTTDESKQDCAHKILDHIQKLGEPLVLSVKRSTSQQSPDTCAMTTPDGVGYRVVMIGKCIEWLKSLRTNPQSEQKAESPQKCSPGMLENCPQSPADASGTKTANGAAVVASGNVSGKAPTLGASASTGDPVENQKESTTRPGTPSASKLDSKTETIEPAVIPNLAWILGALNVVLAAVLVILYFKLNGIKHDLTARVQRRDEKIKGLDARVGQLNDDLARAKEILDVGKRQADLERRGISAQPGGKNPAQPPASAPAPDVAAPPQSPRAAATRDPLKLERTIPNQVLEEVILKAIHALAHERVSLTEANFGAKVTGFATDPSLKAALVERLEPAQFYLCSGARSAQGPELLAYIIRGQSTCSVVPFPTAGRVGQFIRWFENAGGAYDVDPVLAARPARGVINEAGSLSTSELGLLA